MISIEGLSKVIPGEKIYDDLASPAVQEVGQVLRSTVKAARFIVAPIDYLAAQQDRFQKFLKKVSDQVPEERMVEANPQISGKVVEGIKYLEVESLLADLFANLLARAIDKERVSEAHPAFPSIISQLSPDEAVILFELSRSSFKLEQEAKFFQKENLFGPREVIFQEFPLDKLYYPDNFFIYINHLHSLNLAGVWQEGNQTAIFDNGVQIAVKILSYARLTDFGEMFAKACMPKELTGFTDIKK